MSVALIILVISLVSLIWVLFEDSLLSFGAALISIGVILAIMSLIGIATSDSGWFAILFIVGCIAAICGITIRKDRKEKEAEEQRLRLKREEEIKRELEEEWQKKKMERAENEKKPIRLIYDPTKLRPYCVEKWDGNVWVRVSGWMCVEQNANEVYQRLLNEALMKRAKSNSESDSE